MVDSSHEFFPTDEKNLVVFKTKHLLEKFDCQFSNEIFGLVIWVNSIN